MHAGASTTLTQIRQKYWTAQGKSKVQRIISQSCNGRSRWKAKPFALPIMRTLPETRVQVGRPFQHTATDYFGPMKIKTNIRTSKRWVALFTCMTTRAVHLGLAENLSAESFLHCYRRFVSRRGKPETLLSDTATNFLLTSKTKTGSAKQSGTQWHFVTQISPWKGGVYERLVGLTKNALQKAIGRRLLTETNLITYLTEAEAVINQRPLTALQKDSLEVLRPADFLTPDSDSTLDPGEPNIDVYRPEALSTREARLEEWKQTRCSLSRFWQLWSSAYLHFLRERTQREHVGPRSLTRRPPQKGEVVILCDDNHPRPVWKLAIVEETHLRPVSVLFPLEISKPQPTTNKYPEDTALQAITSD
uniref:Integrase catalytic domain-containing protein n=1 Tax=Toxocara canis TaxID=6265 RepID=A0A183TWK9_TOXCA